MRLLMPLVALALTAVACASATPIPDQDRALLETELTGQPRYLRVSMYQAPFWSDESKHLLSPTPPQELALFTDAHGADVMGPSATGILPAGTRVRIEKVELPTGMVVAGRLPYSPRYNPWVYLSVGGQPDGKPAIVVLRSDIKSRDQFRRALDKLLSAEDPAPRIASYSEEIRKGIAEKQVVRDMDPEAVEMAWGPPVHRSIDEGKRTEVWTYEGGKRTVSFSDGKVVASETNAQPAAATPPTSP